MSSTLQGSTNETVVSTKTNWKIDPSFLNFSFPSSFQQEPHPTKRSTPEQLGSLRLRLSPSHPSGTDETSILLQGNTHTSPGGLIYIAAIPVSLQSLLPLLAQPCLDPGCQLQSSSPHSCLVQSDSQDMCSEFSAMGFPFPFQLWIDFLQCLHIACIWLLLADFRGDIGQVSFHWKATKRQLESIQQRVNSLFLMSEESWGRSGFRYSRTQEPKRYYGVRSPNDTMGSTSPS